MLESRQMRMRHEAHQLAVEVAAVLLGQQVTTVPHADASAPSTAPVDPSRAPGGVQRGEDGTRFRQVSLDELERMMGAR